MASSYFLPRYHPDLELPDDEEKKQKPMPRSTSVRFYDSTQKPNPPRRLQPIDEVAEPPPFPATQSTDDPPETATPSFHAPQTDEPATDATDLNDSSVSGHMQKLPMLPAYTQQQAKGRMTNTTPYGDESATTEADAPPATQHLDDPDAQRGFPQDSHPPETTPVMPSASRSRWLRPIAPPWARGTQVAANPMQQPGARPNAPSSPQGIQQQDDASTLPSASQAQKQGQFTAPQNDADVEKNEATGPAPQALKTTIRIGNYPGFEKANPEKKELDDWNTSFRTTYGTFAVDAARKNGVPARLLAALSANEMAAENWGALHAFADTNTLATKSVGPLQISTKTALRYKLVPIGNEFYGAGPDERRTALHDPEVRYGQPSPSTGLTPSQRLTYYQDNPNPNNPNGSKVIHDYLDNPATSFDAGAKLLKVYLQHLVDDYKSGAYLKYSNDFRVLTGLSSPDGPIHKDLNILASGDKEAILNLHFSERLAQALAMIWNNGEDIVNVENLSAESPNAYKHGNNMNWQQENQDDLIPSISNTQPLP